MARDKSATEVLFDDLVRQSVTAVLQPVGFRKSALSFHRRHGEVVQVVNIQSSQYSSRDEKQFYINVGLAFDALCRLTGAEIPDRPRIPECDACGTRSRLEDLVKGVPDRWSITAASNAKTIAAKLHRAIEKLAAELQQISDVRTYRTHRWFEGFRPTQVNAQMLYVLGDLDAAWDEVQQLCRTFADRQNINRPEWWVQNLGLQKLAGRLDREPA
jgi:hypothetical protein